MKPSSCDKIADEQRRVHLLDRTLLELALERANRVIVLGDDHHAGRILIQPVHDTRSQFPADALQVRAVRQNRIDQRPRRIPCSRMHHHPRRFVHDEDVAIFIYDIQWQRFRLDRNRLRRRNTHRHHIASAHFVCGANGTVSFTSTSARFDQALRRTARQDRPTPQRQSYRHAHHFR